MICKMMYSTWVTLRINGLMAHKDTQLKMATIGLQEINQRQLWHHRVWSTTNIPKHAFIAGQLKKLRTMELLLRTGVCSNAVCFLCNTGVDSHLFFLCAFNAQVCRGVMGWLQINDRHPESLYVSWKTWGRKYRSKKQVCYAALAATVY